MDPGAPSRDAMSDHEPDPLIDPGHPAVLERLLYAQGVLLDDRDLRAEQTYHRGRLARALYYLHGTGTVAGLRVTWHPEVPDEREEELRVAPGIAIDRAGRLIELPRDACIRLDRWYRGADGAALTRRFDEVEAAVVADVFIRFAVCERGKTPAFAGGPFDALDTVVPSRLRDAYEVQLIISRTAPPPLPAEPLPDVVAGDTQSLRQAIFDAWEPPEPVEYVVGQDSTSVFLARIYLPAEPAPDGERPVRIPGAAVRVDNDSRLFVYTAGALARWAGI